MNNSHTSLFLASLAVTALLHSGPANATDHPIWRDQVPRRADSVTVLESKAADPRKNYGNDSLLWRDQVKVASKNRVLILEPAGQRYAKTSDGRLWRDQIKSESTGYREVKVGHLDTQ